MRVRPDRLWFVAALTTLSTTAAALLTHSVGYAVIVCIVACVNAIAQWRGWVENDSLRLFDHAIGAGLFGGLLPLPATALALSAWTPAWNLIGPGYALRAAGESGFGDAVLLVLLGVCGLAEGLVGMGIGALVFRFVPRGPAQGSA